MLVLSRLFFFFGGGAREKRAGLWSKVEGLLCLSRLWARDLKLGVTCSKCINL